MNGQKIRLGAMYEDAFTLMMSYQPESFVLGEAGKTWDINLVVSEWTRPRRAGYLAVLW